MVEINNQRKAFLDMLAWSEGTDTLTSENQKSWLWRHCRRRRAIYWLPDHPRKLVTLNPNSNQQAPDATSSFPLVDAYRKQLGLKDFSPKSQDAVALQIKERGALPMIDRGDIRQAIDRCSNIWASLPGAPVMVSSSIRLTAWLQKFKEAGGTAQRDWCMSRVTAIISALVICKLSSARQAVNHYRDNAITYKAQRDKNARELKLANAAITSTCRCVSVMLLRSMQNMSKVC